MHDSNSTKHSFITLDGLRGLAAISVVILHMPRVFAGFSVPNAHLAVDFFLQLSGFVIAAAYSARIADGMSVGMFMWLRINRLLPAFVIGIGLGIIVGMVALTHPKSGLTVNWTGGTLACASLQNVFMLPAVGCGSEDFLFPLNPPMWSVFDELLVNLLFFLYLPLLLSPRITVALAVVAFAGLAPFVIATDGLSFGFGWHDFAQGLLRNIASFLVGVSVFNFRFASPQRSDLACALLFLVLGCALFAQVRAPMFELGMVVLLFPAIIVAGSCMNPKGNGFSWLCVQLGKISYVLYAIHKPLYQICYAAMLKLAPGVLSGAGALVGVAMVGAFVLISWRLAVGYEPSARAALNDVLARRLNRQGAA